MKLIKHLLVVPGMILLLATLCLAECLLKSGDTTPEIDVVMWNSSTGATCAEIIDPNDVTVRYHEEGEAWESYSDAIEKTSATAAWVSKACLSSPTGDVLTVCLPADAADGGIGKYLTVRVITPTYEGTAHIKLGAPVDAYLSDGTTPPDINVSSGIVEANIKEIEDVEAGLDEIADAVLDEALSGHTTAGTTGKAISDILADTGTDGVVLKAAGLEDDAALEIANRVYGLDMSDPNLSTEYANQILGMINASINDIPSKGNVSGGTGTVQDATYANGKVVTVTLGSSAIAYDSYYNGMWIKFTTSAAGSTSVKITNYVGSTKVATLSQGILPQYATPGYAVYEISEESSIPEESGFGINIEHTSREKRSIFGIKNINDDASKVVTVQTHEIHGYKTGDVVTISGTTNFNDASKTITVTGATTFTYTDSDTDEAGETAGTVTAVSGCTVSGDDTTTELWILLLRLNEYSTLYEPGSVVRYRSYGVWHDGIVKSSTYETITGVPYTTLTVEVQEDPFYVPDDESPVYCMGKNYAYLSDTALATMTEWLQRGVLAYTSSSGNGSTRSILTLEHVLSADDDIMPGTILLVEVAASLSLSSVFECAVVKDYDASANEAVLYRPLTRNPVSTGGIVYIQRHLTFPSPYLEYLIKTYSKQGF